jgi:hypothetical protein
MKTTPYLCKSTRGPNIIDAVRAAEAAGGVAVVLEAEGLFFLTTTGVKLALAMRPEGLGEAGYHLTTSAHLGESGELYHLYEVEVTEATTNPLGVLEKLAANLVKERDRRGRESWAVIYS